MGIFIRFADWRAGREWIAYRRLLKFLVNLRQLERFSFAVTLGGIAGEFNFVFGRRHRIGGACGLAREFAVAAVSLARDFREFFLGVARGSDLISCRIKRSRRGSQFGFFFLEPRKFGE